MLDDLKQFDASTVQTEAHVTYTIQSINNILTVSKDKNSQKQAIVLFFNKLHKNLSSTDGSPKSKFMNLMILREYADRNAKTDNDSKIFSHLASHKLFTELREQAEKVDPHKQVQDKGKSIFAGNAALGNDFIRLILEMIRYLSERYAYKKSSQPSEPTSYKKTYDNLLEKGVTFPNQYSFFQQAKKSKLEGNSAYDSQRTKAAKPQQTGRSNLKSQINYMHTRILTFIESLDDDDPSKIDYQIRKMHGITQTQLPKYERMTEEVMNQNDQPLTIKYFAIQQFLNKQMGYYYNYIDQNKDYGSYITAIKMDAQKIFPQAGGQENAQGPSNTQARPSKIQNSRNAGGAYPPKPPLDAATNQLVVRSVADYFTKLQQRSKSPISRGFQAINQSLSKEKSSNLRRSRSPINHSKNLAKSITSLKESKLAAIFTNPPNRFPESRPYEGRQVNGNWNVSSILGGINKNQGIRRFKTANFKAKSSLFENQHLQIGYKTQAVYQQNNQFRIMIKIQLYFGNLSNESVTNLQISFKGDQNVLLYANPKTIDKLINNGGQNKIDLIVIPLRTPFPLLVMTARYKANGAPLQFKVALPNSVLKLAHFMDINKSEFNSRWKSAQTYKTQQFRLCHYLPPDTLNKWIPALSQFSSYQAFSASGSNKDYELCCGVIMLQRYEGLLKVNVRPNLNVVLQLGIQDRKDEATNYFTFFLQTLQEFLKEVS